MPMRLVPVRASWPRGVCPLECLSECLVPSPLLRSRSPCEVFSDGLKLLLRLFAHLSPRIGVQIAGRAHKFSCCDN